MDPVALKSVAFRIVLIALLCGHCNKAASNTAASAASSASSACIEVKLTLLNSTLLLWMCRLKVGPVAVSNRLDAICQTMCVETVGGGKADSLEQ